MSAVKRLFFATHIRSEKISKELLPVLKNELKFCSISWARPEQIHVTLKFFGDTPGSRIPDIETAVKRALSGYQPFTIQLKNVRMFGSRYKPQVIWIGMEDGGILKKMFYSVRENLEKAGFVGDRQNFVPHLTMGRIKTIDNLQKFQSVLADFADYEAETLTVKEFALYESILRPEGALHILLKKFIL